MKVLPQFLISISEEVDDSQNKRAQLHRTTVENPLSMIMISETPVTSNK
jgi:hypothetical protein